MNTPRRPKGAATVTCADCLYLDPLTYFCSKHQYAPVPQVGAHCTTFHLQQDMNQRQYDWEGVSDLFHYATTTAEGHVCYFQNEPVLDLKSGRWMTSQIGIHCTNKQPPDDGIAWFNSLSERPKSMPKPVYTVHATFLVSKEMKVEIKPGSQDLHDPQNWREILSERDLGRVLHNVTKVMLSDEEDL